MKSLFYSLTCFVLFSVFSLSAQAVVFPQHRPCMPNSAEVTAQLNMQQWAVGPAISLLQQDSLAGWATLSGKAPSEAWSVKDGVLHLKGKGGDIVSDREYENFILEFSWTISKGGNSGIKYRFKKYDGKGWLGLEYQTLDDFNTPEGKKTKNNTATLYDILSTEVSKKHLNPNDQLNYGKVIIRGQHIEHYLNGEKVLEIIPGSRQWFDAVAYSKFKDVKDFGLNTAGKIMIQDHNCEVWFHSITIRELYPTAFSVNQPVHHPSLPYFSESRDAFCAAPVNSNFPNFNNNQYFGQYPPQSVKKSVSTTPYSTIYYVPMSVPKHRCIFPNLFNR